MIFVGNTWIYTKNDILFTENFIKEKITEEQKIYFYNMITLFLQEMLKSATTAKAEFIKSYVYDININEVLQNAYDVVCHPCLLDQVHNNWNTFHIIKDFDLWIYPYKDKEHYTFWFDPNKLGFQHNYYLPEDFNSNEDYESYMQGEYHYQDSLSKLLHCATLNNYMNQETNSNFYILKQFKHEFSIEKLIDKYVFNLK